MSYKWRPSAAQRKAFATKMQDADERKAYEERKETKANKRRSSSKFDYKTAGGNYVPTNFQYSFAIKHLNKEGNSTEQNDACHKVIFGYTCNQKTDHDSIHIINEMIRGLG